MNTVYSHLELGTRLCHIGEGLKATKFICHLELSLEPLKHSNNLLLNSFVKVSAWDNLGSFKL